MAMPRLEVELTSARPDGTWTWRKAGARQPKGEVSSSLLPAEVKVGDVLKVEADMLIDGIEITEVFPNKGAKTGRFETIEMKGRPDPESFVSSQLAPKGRGGDRKGGRRDRGDRDDRPRGDGRGGDSRGPRSDGDRGPRRDGGDRRPRAAMPDLPERPKPKKIRPLRTHRTAALESLPPEQRPIAEQALQGGIPAVRLALETQNTNNLAQGLPEVQGDELIVMAERLLPRLNTAEWRDRAEAAMTIIDEVDLRDLRSVVVAADNIIRDEELTALKASLSEAYTRRADAEHASWLDELKILLDSDRTVRALRVSSRPPKAGVPLPKELAERLATAASASLTKETFTDRWDTVLDALCFSPVRTIVKATSLPETITDELKAIVEGVAERLPQIAEQFGIDPATVPKRARKRPGQERRGPKKAAGSGGRPGSESGRGDASQRPNDRPGKGDSKKAAPSHESNETTSPVLDDVLVEAAAVPVETAPVRAAQIEAAAPADVAPAETTPEPVAAEAPADPAPVEPDTTPAPVAAEAPADVAPVAADPPADPAPVEPEAPADVAPVEPEAPADVAPVEPDPAHEPAVTEAPADVAPVAAEAPVEAPAEAESAEQVE